MIGYVLIFLAGMLIGGLIGAKLTMWYRRYLYRKLETYYTR